MTIESQQTNPVNVPSRHEPPRGGIYDLPVVGPRAIKTREFFDNMAPQEGDSAGVKAGKNTLRYGAVAGAGVAGAAVAAIVVL